MKVAFTTLGCRTNQQDTAEMATVLAAEGFSIVSAQEPADVYVVNTCTVTANSDRQSRLAVKKSLAINDKALVVFTGCYAQMNPEESLALPGMDIVLGNANKLEIAAAIKNRLRSRLGSQRQVAAELRKCGNVTPLISVEGTETISDQRRGGRDVLNKTMQGIHNCVKHRVITGVCTSVCKTNLDDLVNG